MVNRKTFIVVVVLIIGLSMMLTRTGESGANEKTIEAPKVKLGIEEAAEMSICSNASLLNFAGIDRGACHTKLKAIAPVCWLALDKIVLDYTLPANEEGKEKLFNLAYVFILCAQSEILMPLVNPKRAESSSPN